MKITCLPALTSMLLLSLFGCKKGVEQSTGTTTPVTNPVVQQGNYSGQFLTLSTTEKLASPWVELGADTAYTSYTIASGRFKNIPAGYEDKVVSFYLPKNL